MKQYDFLIIGTGSGNIVLDAALDAGLNCAVIEKGKFGGTCLTRGCIPTKMLITPVDLKRDFERMVELGLVSGSFEFNWQAVGERMWQRIDTSKGILEEYADEENLDIYQGRGYFTGEKTLQVEYADGSLSEPLNAEIIVIAAGGRTNVPPIKGLSETGYLTSESFFGDLFPEEPFKSLIIVGGGAIGTEFAHLFSALGTEVTIIQHADRLLPKNDPEISHALQRKFLAQGIKLELGSLAIEAQRMNGRKCVVLRHVETEELKTIEGCEILIAPGIVPNSDLMRLDRSCLALNESGWVRTNEYLETSCAGVYCIGDANGKPQLRHKANYEADILAYNLFTRKDGATRRCARYDTVPAAVFTHPQVASVGLNTAEAEAKGYRVAAGIFYYGQTAKAYALGVAEDDRDQFVKVISDADSGRMLGVQAIGPEASVVVQPYANLINSGTHRHEMIEPEIASAETIADRAAQHEDYLDPRHLDAVNRSMVIHPALSEVAIWAASEVKPTADGAGPSATAGSAVSD